MIERYAFITNENHALHVNDKWPDAIFVGDSYRMVQFTDKDEPDLIDYIESIGFKAKHLNVSETISSMKGKLLGPFVCNHYDASLVVGNFNSSGEI